MVCRYVGVWTAGQQQKRSEHLSRRLSFLFAPPYPLPSVQQTFLSICCVPAPVAGPGHAEMDETQALASVTGWGGCALRG